MYDLKKLYLPNTVEKTIELMKKHPSAHILAGGSDLLIKIRDGKMAGIECISIFGMEELQGIYMDEQQTICIRSLESFSRIEKNEIIKTHVPVLAEAVGMVGGPQIRNIGTVGGNLCNGVTSADSASTLLVLGATLTLTSDAGSREVPLQEFYLGPGKVDLRPAELLTQINIPKQYYHGYHGAFIKYAMRKAMDISTLNCAVTCKLSEDKQLFEDVRIAFGVAGPVPMRCTMAERSLCRTKVNEEGVALFVEQYLSEITPRSSWRASRELRMQLAEELGQRALRAAVLRAGGTL